MTTFFTSDLHLFHRAVSYRRRYHRWPEDRSLVIDDDVQWHCDLLAHNWDATVRRDDIVWVLGDLTANDKHVSEALDWINERPGSKHFIAGNHDPCHPMHGDAHKWQRTYLAPRPRVSPFLSVQAFARRVVKINGERMSLRLSHFPYHGDHTSETRFDEWRLRPSGSGFLLHGHTHSAERLHGNQIHIGVDAWDFAPVSQEAIVKEITAAQDLHWIFRRA